MHARQPAVQLEQQRQIQEIVTLHIVVQMLVVNLKLETVIVVFVLHPLVQAVGIVIQIWAVGKFLIH